MTDILKMNLKPSEHACESRVGDETVLLHLESGIYYGLDAVGTRIWELLKEGHLPDALCSRIAEEYGVELSVVEGDARRFLADLVDHAIAVEA